MLANYTLKSGEKISIFMWSDFFDEEAYRGTAEVFTYNEKGQRNDKEFSTLLYKDDGGLYIIWKGEKIYLNKFDYLPYETLMAKIAEGKRMNDRWFVSDDEILATFMKESEKVMVFASMPVYEIVTPFGFALCGNKELEVPCRLSTVQYPKTRWGYKITLEPITEELRNICAKEHYYFSDFCSMLKSDIFALANENMDIA